MLDTDLKIQLEKINAGLVKIQRGLPWWRTLLNGILSGLGSVVGVALALFILGFILNVIGIIPAFRREVDSWRNLLQQTQQQKIPALKSPQSSR